MGYTRGISEVEERARSKRDYATRTRSRGHWSDKKFEGRHVCDVCGEFIRTKRGDTAVRYEKKTLRLGRNKKETFWTYRHKKCGPEEEA